MLSQTEIEKLKTDIDEIINADKVVESLDNCVCVFGSSSIKESEKSYKEAFDLGFSLAKAGFSVMTGGGPGLVEAVNKGVSKAGGMSVGMCMEFPGICIENDFIDPKYHFLFKGFSSRKYIFWKSAIGFVALPGGLGTLDEITECLTLMQMDIIKKRPLILFDENFWQPFSAWLDNTLKNKFKTITNKDLELFSVSDSVSKIIEKLKK